MWVCNSCGKENGNDRVHCWSCPAPKDKTAVMDERPPSPFRTHDVLSHKAAVSPAESQPSEPINGSSNEDTRKENPAAPRSPLSAIPAASYSVEHGNPQPKGMFENEVPSRPPGMMKRIVVVVIGLFIAGGLLLHYFPFHTEANDDADTIDDMVKSLEAAGKNELDKGNFARAEYFVSVMSGLGLEKRLILTSPLERKQKDIDDMNELVHHGDYGRTLHENLSVEHYEQLQRLRKKYKYIRD